MLPLVRLVDLPPHLRPVGEQVHRAARGRGIFRPENPVTIGQVDAFEVDLAQARTRLPELLESPFGPLALVSALNTPSKRQLADLRRYLESPDTYQRPKVDAFVSRVSGWLDRHGG